MTHEHSHEGPASARRIVEGSYQGTAVVSIFAAVVLVALKLGTGIATGSLSLISAGIESSGDVVAAVLTLLAVRIAGRPADEDHPYGHRRAENLAALGEAAILSGGAVFITIEAIGQLVEGGEHVEATWYIFAVIGVAICIDVSRIVVSLRTANKHGSAALRSNAFHFAADLTGSLAVLVGMVIVALGVPAGDAIAALVVAVVIFGAAGRLVYENARVLIDTMPTNAYEQAIAAVQAAVPQADVHRVRVRESGGRFFADVVVGLPAGQAVAAVHDTADTIEAAVADALPGSDVVVHVEPGGHDLTLRDEILAVALRPAEVREVHDVNVYRYGAGAIVTLHVKFDRDVPLTQAHHVADQIEQRLRDLSGVDDARTHLEPLEPTQRSARDEAGEHLLDQEIGRLVERTTGRPPVDLRVLRIPSGMLVLLTVTVEAGLGLRKAHDIAGELEADIHREHHDIADVVVHTEPASGPAARP